MLEVCLIGPSGGRKPTRTSTRRLSQSISPGNNPNLPGVQTPGPDASLTPSCGRTYGGVISISTKVRFPFVISTTGDSSHEVPRYDCSQDWLSDSVDKTWKSMKTVLPDPRSSRRSGCLSAEERRNILGSWAMWDTFVVQNDAERCCEH